MRTKLTYEEVDGLTERGHVQRFDAVFQLIARAIESIKEGN